MILCESRKRCRDAKFIIYSNNYIWVLATYSVYWSHLLRFLKVTILAASKNSGGMRNKSARLSATAIADK